MKTIHLLATEESPETLRPLVAAAEAADFRVGWLDLAALVEPPPALAAALEAGIFRAVARFDGGVAGAKRVAGSPVVADLLREQFRGCRLVLVRGEVDAPRLTARGDRWSLASEAGRLELDTERLVGRLRRPASTFLDP